MGVIVAVPMVGRDFLVAVALNGLRLSQWQSGWPETLTAEQGVEQIRNPVHNGDSVRLVVLG